MQSSKNPFAIHPIAQFGPAMPEDQYVAFLGDIARRGQQVPIVLYQGKVLDGRARQRALVELGKPILYVEFAGDRLAAWQQGRSLNNHRAHIDAGQRVAALYRAMDRLPEVKAYIEAIQQEAMERRNGNLAQNQGSPKAAGMLSGKSSTQIAALAGTSAATVERVRAVRRMDAALFEDVADGKINASQAFKAISKKNRTFEAVISGKYRVVLADPPWQYNAGGMGIESSPALQYPLMELEAIKAIPVKEHVHENAVLFLWTTSMFLAKALEVVEAWGFAYKSGLIWKKRPKNGAGIVTGGWSKLQHEHLLICTRGRIEPDKKVVEPSVMEFPITENSRKPAYYRDLIDRMFPVGKRLELFSREKVKGWDCLGNEI